MPAPEILQAARTADEKTAKQPPAPPRPFLMSFLDHLVRNAIISTEIAKRAATMKQQSSNDRRTALDVLHEEFGIARETLQFQVAQFYAFRTLDISGNPMRRLSNADALKIVRALPEHLRALAMKHKVLPYDLSENQPDKLVVVTPNPSDRETSEVARSFPYKKFEICYIPERDWDNFWRLICTDRGQLRAAPVIADVVGEQDDQESTVDREINRTQLPSMVDSIIADAVRVQAAAVHFIPRHARRTDVYFRIDGVLSQWKSFDEIRADAVVAVMKMKTPGMDRYERLAAQEGVSIKTADGKPVHLRVSTIPVLLPDHAGKFERMVIQIDREPAASWRLESLGLDETALRAFREVLGMRSGLVVLSGPAGSGVTTTMAAIMRAMLTPSLSALSVEESMDFAFEGVSHVRLTPKLSHDAALSVIEHHDPDVIILGEIRDRQGAEIALRLAMKGKHVFATLQASDAAGAIVRLQGFGIESYLLAQALTLVHAQRLVRRLCPQCRMLQPGSDPRLERLGLQGGVPTLYRPVGCVDCVNGYSGRIPLHETLLVTPSVRSLITNGAQVQHEGMHAELEAQGASSLSQAGAGLLREGVTTVDELWGVLS